MHIVKPLAMILLAGVLATIAEDLTTAAINNLTRKETNR